MPAGHYMPDSRSQASPEQHIRVSAYGQSLRPGPYVYVDQRARQGDNMISRLLLQVCPPCINVMPLNTRATRFSMTCQTVRFAPGPEVR